MERDPGKEWPTLSDRRFLRLGPTRYYWEDGMQAGMAFSFETIRHDQPLSRRRWQFAPRRERVLIENGEGR
jgi:CRISPR system Cascade subunit CasD